MVLEIPLPESLGPGWFLQLRFLLALFNGNVHGESSCVGAAAAAVFW